MEKSQWCNQLGIWLALVDAFQPKSFEQIKNCQHHRGKTQCLGCDHLIDKPVTAHFKEHQYILQHNEVPS